MSGSSDSSALPRQLADFAPLPGVIKDDYTDFIVEEIPLYPADGAGTHTYFLLEKAGLTTHQAVHHVAQALGVKRHDLGYAGLKDARAITRQWMSVEHIEPERVKAIEMPRLRILEAALHTNKLRLGHLKGNRFMIRVRRTATERLAEVQDALAQLAQRGVPNCFGPQRFGYRGDTWEVGRAIVRGDIEEAMHLILGKPGDLDHGAIRRARQLFEKGNYAAAAREWPSLFHSERRVLKLLARTEGKLRKAFGAIDRRTRTFYVSAYQSQLFNRLLTARLPAGLDQLQLGDLAWLHASGAVFRVLDTAVEQPRADRFDISPTGPLFGYRMTQPEGEPGRVEAELLAGEGLPEEALRTGSVRVKGGRRPLRFPLTESQVSLGADERGAYLELQFVLPRGCYATAVLRELFSLSQAADEDASDEETEVEAE